MKQKYGTRSELTNSSIVDQHVKSLTVELAFDYDDGVLDTFLGSSFKDDEHNSASRFADELLENI